MERSRLQVGTVHRLNTLEMLVVLGLFLKIVIRYFLRMDPFDQPRLERLPCLVVSVDGRLSVVAAIVALVELDSGIVAQVHSVCRDQIGPGLDVNFHLY